MSGQMLNLEIDLEAIEASDMGPEDRTAILRFTSPNFAVKDGRSAETLRGYFFAAAVALVRSAPHSKSRAVALTELETAMMWAVKAFYGAPGEGA